MSSTQWNELRVRMMNSEYICKSFYVFWNIQIFTVNCGSNKFKINKWHIFDLFLSRFDRPDRRACLAMYFAAEITDDCMGFSATDSCSMGEAFFYWWEDTFAVDEYFEDNDCPEYFDEICT